MTIMNFCVKRLLILVCIVMATTGCEKMNDKHKSWFENGEIVYIGKVDSLNSFSGENRIVFEYWISDPRVKTLSISWAIGQQKIEIPVPQHLPGETLELEIDDISEGIHSFQWITQDNHGNKSIVFETTANVYGERYRNSLSNRPLISAQADGTDVTLTWSGRLNNNEIKVSINYTNTSDVLVNEVFESEELSTPVVITDVKLTAPVMYQTFYLPEPSALDTFFTAMQKIDVMTTINVVLNKPVTQSDFNVPGQEGQMAVNGDRSTATRWVSDDSNNEHWIDIDLQGSYAINAMGLWRDISNAAQQMPQFSLQAWIDGEWVDVVSEDNNTMSVYYKEFDSVTTNRVRLYFPPYLNNRIRLNQLEVYSIIRY